METNCIKFHTYDTNNQIFSLYYFYFRSENFGMHLETFTDQIHIIRISRKQKIPCFKRVILTHTQDTHMQIVGPNYTQLRNFFWREKFACPISAADKESGFCPLFSQAEARRK